jgi:hypothetical protein
MHHAMQWSGSKGGHSKFDASQQRRGRYKGMTGTSVNQVKKRHVPRLRKSVPEEGGVHDHCGSAMSNIQPGPHISAESLGVCVNLSDR